MTIGDFGQSTAAHHDLANPNPDFVALIECRKRVAQATQLPEQSIELSMGMSNDFDHAIQMGSTNVRVGSSIFGSRIYEAGKTPQEVHDQRLTTSSSSSSSTKAVVESK